MANPICGNCANPLSAHFVERYGDEARVYCNQQTSGDVFTDEPTDEAIMEMLLERHPQVYEGLRTAWRQEHGHAN